MSRTTAGAPPPLALVAARTSARCRQSRIWPSTSDASCISPFSMRMPAWPASRASRASRSSAGDTALLVVTAPCDTPAAGAPALAAALSGCVASALKMEHSARSTPRSCAALPPAAVAAATAAGGTARGSSASRNAGTCHSDWMMAFRKQLYSPSPLRRPRTSCSLRGAVPGASYMTAPASVTCSDTPASLEGSAAKNAPAGGVPILRAGAAAAAPPCGRLCCSLCFQAPPAGAGAPAGCGPRPGPACSGLAPRGCAGAPPGPLSPLSCLAAMADQEGLLDVGMAAACTPGDAAAAADAAAPALLPLSLVLAAAGAADSACASTPLGAGCGVLGAAAAAAASGV
mmetsp:Transcript_13455/g.32921  ORF Transcript_13455/g.32921 Transcript_13455/m.32921 type:complete len:344 (+) Transcript_13455:2257-3288(+)